MSKRLITLIVLVVVLGGAIGAYFIVKSGILAPKPPEDTGTSRVQVDRFEVEKVQKMVLSSPERTLTIVKKDGSWKLDLPYEVELDETKIEDIAYSFSGMYAESLVEEEPADLAPYGLATPAQEATAYLTDGTTRTYFLGSRTPAGNTYYLMPKGSTSVYAVWMNHGTNFSSTVKDLRYRKMPTLDKETFKYLSFAWRGGRTLELQNALTDGPDLYVFGGWVMTKPYRQPRGVDGEALQSLFDAVYFTEIKDFAEDDVKDLAKYGLDPAEGEIVIKDATTTLHILVGKNVDEYTTYFRYPNSRNVYTIDRQRIDVLRKSAFPLADKFAFIVNIDWVDQVLIQHRDGRSFTIDLKREGKDENGNWKSTFWANGKEIADEPFRKFYQAIIGVLLDGEADRDVRGTPVATFTYRVAADEETRRKAQTVKLEFVDYNRDFYLVRRDGVGEFVTAKGRDLEQVFTQAEAIVK